MKRSLSIAVVVGVLLTAGMTGCARSRGPANAESTQESGSPTENARGVYSEAPLLARLVATGDLPPVEERLPVNPVVIQPVERVGVYGGTWHMGATKTSNHKYFRINAGYENLLRWNPSWTRIIPNVAQSYDVSADASEFTIHLREGLRWSDGTPFTADDIVFWYEADLLNQELHDSIPSYLVMNGTPLLVEEIDPHTVRFRFAGPYGQFPDQLAQIGADEITARPMHYLAQFHPGYNPDGIEALIADAGVENWLELWNLMKSADRNPHVPTLNAWVLTDWAILDWDGGDATSYRMERNPFYWKIDTDFNQLPYIDSIEFVMYPSTGDVRQAAREGQIDMQYYLLSIRNSNYADWAAAATEGDYELHTLVNPRSNYFAIMLNLVHQNPVLRSVFSDKSFRIALSHAINRTDVIEQILGIPLEPRQPAPLRESPLYREQLETQYTEFDPSYANQLLDEAGYGKRDQEGYRLTPEGMRIEFTLSVREDPIVFGAAEMVSEYWGELGILVHIEQLEDWPLTQMVRANEHDAIISPALGGLDAFSNPGIFMPQSEYQSYWAIPWVYWYEGNPAGEEPPAQVMRQMELYDQTNATTDQHKVNELVGQILAIAEEEFFVMGICRNEDFFMLVKSNFHNVPPTMPKSFTFPTPAPTNPSQYFIEVQ